MPESNKSLCKTMKGTGTMARTTVKMAMILFFTALSLTIGMNAWAVQSNDAAALKGLKLGKVIFLLNVDSPQKAALYLNIIIDTRKTMAAQKVKPDFIVIFVGPTVRFLTTAPDAELAGKQQNALASIAASVTELKKKGVRMEICEIATNFFKVPNDKLLPGPKLVGNGFTSLIGYQSNGYGLVPIF